MTLLFTSRSRPVQGAGPAPAFWLDIKSALYRCCPFANRAPALGREIGQAPTFTWQEHIRFLRAEMPYGIVRLIDRRQPAIFTALPPTAFLLRKNSAGLFDEGKSDDDKEESRRNTCVFQGSMTQSALICAVEKRVCPCQAKVSLLLIAGRSRFWFGYMNFPFLCRLLREESPAPAFGADK